MEPTSPASSSRVWSTAAIVVIVICLLFLASATTYAVVSGRVSFPFAQPTPDLVTPYRAMVSTNDTKVSAAVATVREQCPTGDFSLCRDAVSSFDSAVHAFQADLDTHPAPACLKAADADLRAALALYDHGAQEVITGIDTLNPTLTHVAVSDMNTATEKFSAAKSAIQSAKC